MGIFKLKRTKASILTTPPTESIGTVPASSAGSEYEDDGGLSSDEDERNSEGDDSGSTLAATPRSGASGTTTPSRPALTPTVSSASTSSTSKRKSKKTTDYSLSAEDDIVGIVMLEIGGATDLPRLKNATRTGWDMDPFVVVSFGKKVFRTRVIRHSLNPVWNEKLLFHVRRYETGFKIQLSVLDWDKLSSNDHVGDATFDLQQLIKSAPQKDPATGLYAAKENGEHPMIDFQLPLTLNKTIPLKVSGNAVVTFRAKYQPYAALRQRFWRQYLLQYDTDETGTISLVELTSMLDSLGSTLTTTTINSFFTRHGKAPHDGELTVDEAIQSLETEIGRPDSEKRRTDADDSLPDSSVSATPVLSAAGAHGEDVQLSNIEFAGPPVSTDDGTMNAGGPLKPDVPSQPATQPSQQPVLDVAELDSKLTLNSNGSDLSDDHVERVISVKNCPMCHRPRLNSKAEVDIITHLAVCASQDWSKIDRIVVGNFVTASQAQRKWYTNIISKVSRGDYKLGANSANIIVQNRMTGQLEEEKMQVYVRLGIRLLYKGAESQMEGTRARKLLKSLSVKQGIKYDTPESARDIPTFIAFHGLDVNEILDPLDSFKTFNQFFYRKLKASARPVEKPDDPYRLVSAADCRLMAFETISEATRLWIKGREFSVARLLGPAYKEQTEKYVGGALAIFRLAPQDYHRYHSPVDGKIGPMTYIEGEYYTVNPQAIRTALDVYGENARKIVPIDSPQFGRVMAVCVGAMMVGSIVSTVKEGQDVKRGDEFGYFAFGGSTIVLLFEKDSVVWDEDLLINGRASLETLVRVGMGIGNGVRRPAA